MAGMTVGYDLSVATYSPDGRIFQVEYAGKAVESSGTAIGLRCKDGVVLGVEKLMISPMLVSGTNKRTYAITKRIAMVLAGLVADARQLVNRAREEAESFERHYGECIPAAVLADRVSLFVHLYTVNWMVRPFGASILIAAMDDDVKNPVLFGIDPSGSCYQYYGMALGKGKQSAKTEIEKLKLSEMTCEDAIFHAAKILHLVHDENKDKAYELECCWITEATNGVYQQVPAEVMKRAEEAARKALQEAEDS